MRYSGRLRRGGSVGLTDERLLVVTDGTTTSVALGSVESVDFADLDWTLATMSLLLFGFGAFSTTRNVLAGAGFAAAGIASLYLTYRKRDRALVRTHSRPKPLALYPEDAGEFYDAFGDALERLREREAESETGPPEATTG